MRCGCKTRHVCTMLVLLSVIGSALAIVGVSVAATVSAIPPCWFAFGDIAVGAAAIATVTLAGYLFREVLLVTLGMRSIDDDGDDDDDDDDDDDGERGRRIACGARCRVDVPHPKDPRLGDDCLICLEPLRRNVLWLRIAVLADGSVALDVREETLLRPCDTCGYSLHTRCALEYLVHARTAAACLVCKKPLV